MIYRIEGYDPKWRWHGLLFGSDSLDQLKCPTIKEPCTFYFTKYGWKVMGREALTLTKKCRIWKYRIVMLQDYSFSDIVYRDRFQIALKKYRNITS